MRHGNCYLCHWPEDTSGGRDWWSDGVYYCSLSVYDIFRHGGIQQKIPQSAVKPMTWWIFDVWNKKELFFSGESHGVKIQRGEGMWHQLRKSVGKPMSQLPGVKSITTLGERGIWEVLHGPWCLLVPCGLHTITYPLKSIKPPLFPIRSLND